MLDPIFVPLITLITRDNYTFAFLRAVLFYPDFIIITFSEKKPDSVKPIKKIVEIIYRGALGNKLQSTWKIMQTQIDSPWALKKLKSAVVAMSPPRAHTTSKTIQTPQKSGLV